MLAAELPEAVASAASALDAWVAQGKALADRYRGVMRQCAELQHLALVPPPVARELDLMIAVERLALDERVLQLLVISGIVPAPALPRAQRDPHDTLEAYASRRLRQLLDATERRLPPLTRDEEDV